MSFICPTDCSSDRAVSILQSIFGKNFIESFYKSGTPSPALVHADSHSIFPVITSNLSTAALTVVGIIISVSIIRGLMTSANDGEAIGVKNNSLGGAFGRPIFSVAMITPVASGYMVINIIIMAVVLWSNSIANLAYKTFVENDITGGTASVLVDDPNYQSANDMIVPMVYGALQGYCSKYSNYKLNNSVTMRQTNAWIDATGVLSKTTISGAQGQRTTIDYPEDGILGALGITGSVCGKFEVTRNVQEEPAITGDTQSKQLESTVQHDLIVLRKQITNVRVNYILAAYYDGYYYATGEAPPAPDLQSVYQNGGGNPTFTPVPWSMELATNTNVPEDQKPNVTTLINAAKNRKLKLDAEIQRILNAKGVLVADKNGPLPNQPPPPQNGLTTMTGALVNEITAEGWLSAGNYRARFRKFTAGLSDSIANKPYTYGLPNIKVDKDANEQASFIESLNTIRTAIFEQIKSKGLSPSYSMINVDSITYTASNDKVDLTTLLDGPSSGVINAVFNVEQAMINTLIGTGPGEQVDALQRIQMTGDYIFGIEFFIKAIQMATSLAIAMIAVLGATGGGFTDFVYKTGQSYEGINNFYQANLATYLVKLADDLDVIARYFSTIIPTMPYVFLTLAAVGWCIQIIQTMLGMPLFFIMHAVPQRSFLGDQMQGYVTLMTLFFRPLMIVSAFFLAFVLYDPLLTFTTQMYLSLHENVAGSTFDSTILRMYTVLNTFRWYWLIFANLLLVVTYYTFGLVQELGDTIFDWLGTRIFGGGFGNMDTNGVMRNASVQIGGAQARNRQLQAERAKALANRKGGNAGDANATGEGGNGGGNGGNGGARGVGGNDAARNASMSGAMGTGTGSSPQIQQAGQGGFGPTAGANHMGATALITAGSAAIGAARGARQQGTAYATGAAKAASAMAGGGRAGIAAGAAAGTVAGLVGGALGAARGSYGGVTRGLKSWGGRQSYQQNLNEARARGAIGTKGYDDPSLYQQAKSPTQPAQPPSQSQNTSQYGFGSTLTPKANYTVNGLQFTQPTRQNDL